MSIRYLRFSFAVLIASLVFLPILRDDAGDEEAGSRNRRTPIAVPLSSFKLALINPAPESSHAAGQTINISWPTEPKASGYQLQLWTGSSTYLFSSAPSPITALTMQWKIPALFSGMYTLRIFYKDSADGSLLPHAVSTFSVSPIAAINSADIQITSPDRSSSWVLNSQNTISVTLKNAALMFWSADIYCLTTAVPLSFGAVLVSSQAKEKGSYTFIVPLEWSVGNYQVVFSAYADETGPAQAIAISSTFPVKKYVTAVSPTAELISVSVPNFEFEAFKGSVLPISWSRGSTALTRLTIELFNLNTKKFAVPLVQIIGINIDCDVGRFDWEVPATLPASRFYYVRIWAYRLVNGNQFDKHSAAVGYSDYFFIKAKDGSDSVDLEPQCDSCGQRVKIETSEGEPTARDLGGKRPRTSSSDPSIHSRQAFDTTIWILAISILSL